MPSSTLSHKFPLDENARRELHRFLTRNKFDVKLTAKSVSDSQVAAISKKQHRILITNDEDFKHYQKNQIFSVVLLKIAQYDAESLIASFEKLLKELKTLKGKIITLTTKGWEEFPLVEEIKL